MPTADKCLLKKLNEQIKKKVEWTNKSLNKSLNVIRHLLPNQSLICKMFVKRIEWTNQINHKTCSGTCRATTPWQSCKRTFPPHPLWTCLLPRLRVITNIIRNIIENNILNIIIKNYHKHYFKHHLPSPMPESNYSGCFFIGAPQKFVVWKC